MNVFQILGCLAAALFVIGTVRSWSAGRLGPGSAAAWMLFWVATAIAIARPELTVAAARVAGIGRGADLVFYVGILSGWAGFFALHLKVRKIEREITRLVRELAIREAETLK